MAQPHYTDEERLACFTLFVGGVTLEQIAKERTPSIETLKRWSREDGWVERRREIRAKAEEQIAQALVEKRARFVEKAWDKVEKLMEELDKPERLEAATVNQIATTIGILIDKARLERGEPTSYGKQEVNATHTVSLKDLMSGD